MKVKYTEYKNRICLFCGIASNTKQQRNTMKKIIYNLDTLQKRN